IADPGFERQLPDLPVREAAAALVIAQQQMVARDLVQPRAPHRALPVELEMAQPVGRLDERRPFAGERIGDAHAVDGGAEADLLARARAQVRRYAPQRQHWVNWPPSLSPQVQVQSESTIGLV